MRIWFGEKRFLSFWLSHRILNSKHEIRNPKQYRMTEIQMFQILQIVIANEVKQSQEIATSLGSSQ